MCLVIAPRNDQFKNQTPTAMRIDETGGSPHTNSLTLIGAELQRLRHNTARAPSWSVKPRSRLLRNYSKQQQQRRARWDLAWSSAILVLGARRSALGDAGRARGGVRAPLPRGEGPWHAALSPGRCRAGAWRGPRASGRSRGSLARAREAVASFLRQIHGKGLQTMGSKNGQQLRLRVQRQLYPFMI
ncbi:hypothetical protein NDU88_000410 [Pleurodeles waltl]|uniref:Uncharacterized protein n=1 Tax=Pleurodeles waltl TaxID=8319 RepID=A0AAV7L6S5_PLEWA|nr:hypothetical protein NDU88_000410 [Pleurodeles waltl]